MNDSDDGLEKINNNEVINLDDDNEGNQIHNTFYSVNEEEIENKSIKMIENNEFKTSILILFKGT
jgi:hypothetical protein